MRSPGPVVTEHCDLTGDVVFVDGDGLVRLNAHNHTDRSDGAHTFADLASFASRHRVNLAVTDHNMPPDPPGGRMPPGLVAGMEICTQEGVDVVTLGPLDQVHALFEREVKPNLRWWNPRYRATRLPIRELLAATAERGMHCIHPHYGSPEGLSTMAPEVQAQVLRDSRDHGFLEVNALQTSDTNELAVLLAHEWEMPLLRTGDTHNDEDQHVGTWSALPLEDLEQSDEPLVRRLLRSMHRRAAGLRHRVRDIRFGERLKAGWQIFKRNGVAPMTWFGLKTLGRAVGAMRRPIAENLPLRPRPARGPQAEEPANA